MAPKGPHGRGASSGHQTGLRVHKLGVQVLCPVLKTNAESVWTGLAISESSKSVP